jgi:hypothetical protein
MVHKVINSLKELLWLLKLSSVWYTHYLDEKPNVGMYEVW